MKKLILATIALSLVSVQAAFAQNLGALSSDNQPQKLSPASEFTKFLAEKHDTKNVNPNKLQNGSKSNFWGGYGWGGLGYGGYGWGGLGYGGYGYSPYSFGTYAYPYYGYGYGGYGGLGWGGYGYWLDGQGSGTQGNTALANNRANAGTVNQNPAALAPVVCFASDSQGNWFGSADVASNVDQTQRAANHECLEGSDSCVQNLGCALAIPPEAE